MLDDDPIPDDYEDQVADDVRNILGIPANKPWEVLDNQGTGDEIGTEGKPVPAFHRGGGLPPQEARAANMGMNGLWALVLALVAFVSLLIYMGSSKP